MIGEPRFTCERLDHLHDRASFKCVREDILEKYLTDRGRALRENDRNVTAVYVLLDTMQNNRIAGYFTISNSSLIPERVPPKLAKKMPRYDSWGVVKLGRMARHDDYAKSGIGTILVARTFAQAIAIAEKSGSFALVVDAKNERLARWYAELGFEPMPDSVLTLMIANETMIASLKALEKL
jgi:GNAT superfamily N-acetyltransferase